MTKQISPQEADGILDEIAQGNFTRSRVSQTADIPLLAYYLVVLAEIAAPLFPGEAPGTCLNNDSLWTFIRAQYSLRVMVKTARHIGKCPRCKDYFNVSEKDV